MTRARQKTEIIDGCLLTAAEFTDHPENNSAADPRRGNQSTIKWIHLAAQHIKCT